MSHTHLPIPLTSPEEHSFMVGSSLVYECAENGSPQQKKNNVIPNS
jgi:hypothetical protein